MGLYPGKFFENGASRIAETGVLLPQLQAPPQHEGEEADEDMGLHAILSKAEIAAAP